MQQDCYVAEQRGPRSQERKKSAILTSNACASLAIVASEGLRSDQIMRQMSFREFRFQVESVQAAYLS
jgi:hypothetical protein